MYGHGGKRTVPLRQPVESLHSGTSAYRNRWEVARSTNFIISFVQGLLWLCLSPYCLFVTYCCVFLNWLRAAITENCIYTQQTYIISQQHYSYVTNTSGTGLHVSTACYGHCQPIGISVVIILIIIIIIIIFINCNWDITRWQWLFYMYTNKRLVSGKFKSGGLHERHVVATWKLGNHLSIRL